MPGRRKRIPVYLRLRKGLVSAKDRYQGPVRTLEEDEITAG